MSSEFAIDELVPPADLIMDGGADRARNSRRAVSGSSPTCFSSVAVSRRTMQCSIWGSATADMRVA